MPDTMSLLNSVGVNTALYPPCFLAFQTSGTAVASGFGGAAMALGTPSLDSYGGWASGTPSRYTPTAPGWYLFVGGVQWPVNTTGCRVSQLQKNGSTSGSFANSMNALSTSSYFPSQQAIGMYLMNGTTDYVEVWGYQDSGSSLTSQIGGTYMIAARAHL